MLVFYEFVMFVVMMVAWEQERLEANASVWWWWWWRWWWGHGRERGGRL